MTSTIISVTVRLLNLKNDNLRKKFDSIKYDLKKVEEVVYDLSIRSRLLPPSCFLWNLEKEKNFYPLLNVVFHLPVSSYAA